MRLKEIPKMNRSDALSIIANSYHIKWDFKENGLILLDQSLIPYEERYVCCKTVLDVASAIKNMIVRGAPAIGITAAYGMAISILDGTGVEEAAKILSSTRPTAVNLFWAINRCLGVAKSVKSKEELFGRLLDEAFVIHAEDVLCNVRMSEYGADLIPDGGGVITHCNAGALATGGYGTALGVLRSAKKQGKTFTVYVDETRPVLQGARLTVWELKREGFDAVLICDNMAAFLMKQKKISCAVVGADRISVNGDVANKIGTYSLAIVSKFHGVNFYVAAPLSSFDKDALSSDDIPIEERNPDEVRSVRGVCITEKDVKVWNPAFDITPFSMIDAIITEKGIIRQKEEIKIKLGG